MIKRSKNAYRLSEAGEKIRVGTQEKDVFVLPENAKGYREYIDAFYEASTKLSPIAVAQGVDQVAQAMQWDIVHAPDTIKAEGKTYYISNNGDDSRDGLSPQTAWATTQKLWDMYDVLQPGDAVLFERGGEWRKANELTLFHGEVGDNMNLILAKEGVSYGAYGEGPKPILNGSPHDFADVKYWEETKYPNVYACTEKFWNPGIVALNHTRQLGRYDEKVAIKELLTLHNFTGVADLRFDCSYFFEAETNTLYFCSERGNPGERFSSIEIGGRCCLIRTNGDSGLIENFDFIYDGYGVTAGSHVKPLQMHVKNCIFRYLGGCHFGDIRVCGNAVEIYGPCDDFVVESCWIYQMADSGASFQVFQNLKNCSHRNVKFIGNVIEYCHWSLEFNTCLAEGENVTENVWHAYNVLRMGGYGFGSQLMQRTWQAALYNCFGLEEAKNVVCEKNILDRSTSFLYRLRRPGCHDMEFKDNVNIQYEGNNFGTFYEEIKPYDHTAPDMLKEACAREEGGVYIYLD